MKFTSVPMARPPVAAMIVIMSMVVTNPDVRAWPRRRTEAAVRGFELGRYLGKWYELVRMPSWFERDLVNVTADYSFLPDGRVEVLNQGFKHTKDGRHKKARGAAKAAGDRSVGHLKVSFFWPFSSDYIVASVDDDYRHALVFSGKKFWILARTPTVEEKILDTLMKKAVSAGFDTLKALRVKQDW